jgi:GNAT superfamily N-acetyltransferase
VNAPREWTVDGYTVTTDPARVDLDVVVGDLSTSYWAEGRTHAVQAAANAGSRCYSVLDGDGAQVAFARAVTDGATYAYVADVFVVPGQQGRGLGKLLMRCVMEDLAPIERVMLGTRDAHGLYTQVGFLPVAAPERWMERRRER